MIGYVERFLHYLGSVKNASKNTVQSYRHDTLCFLSFAQHHGVANFDLPTWLSTTSMSCVRRENPLPPSRETPPHCTPFTST